LNDQALKGPVNGTAPNPVTNADFTHTLAEVIHRPAVLPIPEFGLRLMYGEMAQVLIEGQRVIPDVATRAGYQFRYPDLRTALTSAT
jgi:NAD dependent epimerase/dehydratase family enzyme